MFQYILDDLRTREDLALAWIYQEYANAQGYNTTASLSHDSKEERMNSYDQTLTRLLAGVLSRPDQREGSVCSRDVTVRTGPTSLTFFKEITK